MATEIIRDLKRQNKILAVLLIISTVLLFVSNALWIREAGSEGCFFKKTESYVSMPIRAKKPYEDL